MLLKSPGCLLSGDYRETDMIKLTVKIEAGDLYDYMLRHSYNSPAGISGGGDSVRAGIAVLDASCAWDRAAGLSAVDAVYQKQEAGTEQSRFSGAAAVYLK